MFRNKLTKGVLRLENRMLFHGFSVGANRSATGALCFNTAMSGYQEAIFDPSYAGQILVFSFPHIGNTGFNDHDKEFFSPSLQGIIIRELPSPPSHHLSTIGFSDGLKAHGIPCLAGVDTQRLIHIVRATSGPLKATIDLLDHDEQYPQPQSTYTALPSPPTSLSSNRIVVLDFGVKKTILTTLHKRSCETITVSPTTALQSIMHLHPSGIVISNGPGDPRDVSDNILTLIRNLCDLHIPMLGICLGHQLLALAHGATIQRLSCGHHSINHPIQSLSTRAVFNTSQNHDYAVDSETLPPTFIPTFLSLADGSLEGFRSSVFPLTAVQFHPEGSPGPSDTDFVFDSFVSEVKRHASQR